VCARCLSTHTDSEQAFAAEMPTLSMHYRGGISA
jgi:hypothetical protein